MLHCNSKVIYISYPVPEAEGNAYYLQPRQICKTQDNYWFTTVPVGRNKLRTLIQDMFKETGIEGNNHNLLNVFVFNIWPGAYTVTDLLNIV